MKALKIIASAAAALILAASVTTGVFAHHGEDSHKKTSTGRHISFSYTVRPPQKSSVEGEPDWHYIPDKDGNIDPIRQRCTNTYRGLKFIRNISSYTVDEKGEDGVIRPVEYRINRYGLYCTSCEYASGSIPFLEEATLVIRKSDEKALEEGTLLEYANYSPEEIDSFRPIEGHIGDCDCKTYDIAELCHPTSTKLSHHDCDGGTTCYVTSTTRKHEMFCTDCGGYVGCYEKKCEISHSKCGEHFEDCTKD